MRGWWLVRTSLELYVDLAVRLVRRCLLGRLGLRFRLQRDACSGCGGRVEAADGVAGLTRWTKDGARDPTIGRPCKASCSRAVPVCVPFQDLAP